MADYNIKQYDRIVGVGAAGLGYLFKLIDNHTLGREESRRAIQLDSKDFCKMHIIMHYIAKLAGIKSYPVTSVGSDDNGEYILRTMRDAGMDTSFVKTVSDTFTTCGFSYLYPDGTGGNISPINGATSNISREEILAIIRGLPAVGARELLLVCPEIPVELRLALLEEGRRRGSYNIASFTSSEAREFETGFKNVDLLAINEDEAFALIGESIEIRDEKDCRETTKRCVKKLRELKSGCDVIITFGEHGCCVCSSGVERYHKALQADRVSTAGAGDAMLAGTVVGLINGLPLDDDNGEEELSSASDLGRVIASLSIESSDTINFDIDIEAIAGYIESKSLKPTTEWLEAALNQK